MVLTSAGPGSSPQHENCTGSNQIGENLRSTQRWNDVPRGTMDEMSSYVRLNLPLPRRQGRAKDCSTSSSNPMMEGPWCQGLFPPATGLWVVRGGIRRNVFERCQSTPGRAEGPVRPANSSTAGVNYGSASPHSRAYVTVRIDTLDARAWPPCNQ